ncbi:hypothetical protein [Microbacterium sp. bgisy207]|jgi:hypothetical protein|uniref:hypothetical protein n=1 Tax=Microbacterium sp. bgisy207 TaxID=3413800 RepID=UPI003EC0B20F
MSTPAAPDSPRGDTASGSSETPAAHSDQSRSPTQRRYDRLFNTGGSRAVGAYLRERVYATFTGLAIVLVVSQADHADADHALLALLFGVLGITIAGLVSDVVSHLAVGGSSPTGQIGSSWSASPPGARRRWWCRAGSCCSGGSRSSRSRRP